jgi:predicted transcriptional regulator
MKSGSKSVKELSEQFGIVDHKLNRIMRDLANQGALVREKETSSDNANGWRYVYKIKENIIDG